MDNIEKDIAQGYADFADDEGKHRRSRNRGKYCN